MNQLGGCDQRFYVHTLAKGWQRRAGGGIAVEVNQWGRRQSEAETGYGSVEKFEDLQFSQENPAVFCNFLGQKYTSKSITFFTFWAHFFASKRGLNCSSAVFSAQQSVGRNSQKNTGKLGATPNQRIKKRESAFTRRKDSRTAIQTPF